MNPLPDGVSVGTLGEILVQLRLLEFGVQAAPPIKDSGNDLIAVRGEAFRAIQVKTCLNDAPRVGRGRLPGHYHILALVQLVEEEGALLLDRSRIYCFLRPELADGLRLDWDRAALSANRIEELFAAAN